MSLKKFFLFIAIFFLSGESVFAAQFDVLVLPAGLFSACKNYFCFPEVSEIVANDVIINLNAYNGIHAPSLTEVRAKLDSDEDLKLVALNVINSYKKSDKINFVDLQVLSQKFGAKSAILVCDFTINDMTPMRRDTWEVLEITNAFKSAYPFWLNVHAVLTDCVNNVVMWSGKYEKKLTDSNDNFLARNQAQAISQLEKIKLYSKSVLSQNISQNVKLRFFPKDVRTFDLPNNSVKNFSDQSQFKPNALEHLVKPKAMTDVEGGYNQELVPSDFIFEF